jgi:hypothetical protein
MQKYRAQWSKLSQVGVIDGIHNSRDQMIIKFPEPKIQHYDEYNMSDSRN